MEIDLTSALLAKHAKREPVLGRYSVSGLYALLNGWEDRPIDVAAALRMSKGTLKHELVQSLMPEYEHEKKIEYPYEEIVLVGRADSLAPDFGIEIKTSDKLKSEAKPWEVMQAKMYCTMFERPFFYLVQPVHTDSKFYLQTLRRVGRDDEYFKKTMDKLLEIHRKNASKSH